MHPAGQRIKFLTYTVSPRVTKFDVVIHLGVLAVDYTPEILENPLHRLHVIMQNNKFCVVTKLGEGKVVQDPPTPTLG